MKLRAKSIQLSGIAAAVTVLSSVSVAQDKAAIEEVTVTAQRREQNIQDVPISMSVITADSIVDAGASSFRDIAMMVPGVTFNDVGTHTMPFIRGMGSVIANPTAVSSVAVYIDEAYFPRPFGTAFELENVQSIEVLKGPQATLYGRNATGGSINLSTKTTMPGDAFEGSAAATVGDYGTRRYSAYVSGSLSEKFAANFTAYSSKHDGWVKGLQGDSPGNVKIDGSRADNRGESLDTEGVSGKLTWLPADSWKVTLGGSYFTFDDTLGVGSRQVDPPLTAAAFGLPVSFFAGVENYRNYIHDNYRDGSQLLSTLNVSYDFSNLKLVSISSYSLLDARTGEEFVAGAVPLFSFYADFKSDSYYQELRLQSQGTERLSWMVGGTYFQEGSVNQPLAILTGPNAPLQLTRWKTDAQSVFVDGTYQINDKMDVTAGVRYTQEDYDSYSLFDATGTFGVGPKSVDSDNVSYRLVLQRTFDIGMAYVSASSGYKSGGINNSAMVSPPFEPEEIKSYEIGLKTDLLAGALRLNAAAFFNDIEDYQATRIGFGGAAQLAINAPKAESWGLESDFTWQLTDQFSLNGGVTWLGKAEFTDANIAGDAATQTPAVDATGNRLAGAAEVSAVLGGQYEIALSADSGSVILGAHANYNSGVYYDIENFVGSGGTTDDAFTIVNANVAYVSAGSKYTVRLWMNNLTDEHYFSSGLNSGSGAIRLGIDSAPRHYGLTAQVRF